MGREKKGSGKKGSQGKDGDTAGFKEDGAQANTPSTAAGTPQKQNNKDDGKSEGDGTQSAYWRQRKSRSGNSSGKSGQGKAADNASLQAEVQQLKAKLDMLMSVMGSNNPAFIQDPSLVEGGRQSSLARMNSPGSKMKRNNSSIVADVPDLQLVPQGSSAAAMAAAAAVGFPSDLAAQLPPHILMAMLRGEDGDFSCSLSLGGMRPNLGFGGSSEILGSQGLPKRTRRKKKMMPDPRKLDTAVVSKSVIKIYVSSVEYDYGKPWSPVRREVNAFGSGFVVQYKVTDESSTNGAGNTTAKNLLACASADEMEDNSGGDIKAATEKEEKNVTAIVTNAHVVAQATYIEIRRAGESTKYVANVKRCMHDVDLAFLVLKDPGDERKFFSSVRPLQVGDDPFVGDSVQAFGFPLGGDEMSLTKGTVSRVEMQHGAHSGQYVLSVDTDTSIAPGNSGGPVLSADGKITGVSFQGISGKDGGFFIAASALEKALREHLRFNRTWHVPDLGLVEQNVESKLLKEFVGMPNALNGVMICKVGEFSPMRGKIRPFDVLTKVDEFPIGSNATIEFREGERTIWDYVYMTKNLGEEVEFEFFRCLDRERLKGVEDHDSSDEEGLPEYEEDDDAETQSYQTGSKSAATTMKSKANKDKAKAGSTTDRAKSAEKAKSNKTKRTEGGKDKHDDIPPSLRNKRYALSPEGKPACEVEEIRRVNDTQGNPIYSINKATVRLLSTVDDLKHAACLLWDKLPEYVIRAGLVFQPQTAYISNATGSFRTSKTPEVVYIMKAFKSPLLAGIEEGSIEKRAVERINDIKINSLNDVIRAFNSPVTRKLLVDHIAEAEQEQEQMKSKNAEEQDEEEPAYRDSNSGIDLIADTNASLNSSNGSQSSSVKEIDGVKMKSYQEILMRDGRKLIMDAVEVEKVMENICKHLSINEQTMQYIESKSDTLWSR